MKAILKIEGKEIEAEISEEQLAKLTEKKKSPFEKRPRGEWYYTITTAGNILYNCDQCTADDERHEVANYCTDKHLLQQQAWRETLTRLLWRWQYENDEPCDWTSSNLKKYRIYFDYEDREFYMGYDLIWKNQAAVYFSTQEKAGQAIEEVVKPFMAEHPDFVW